VWNKQQCVLIEASIIQIPNVEPRRSKAHTGHHRSITFLIDGIRSSRVAIPKYHGFRNIGPTSGRLVLRNHGREWQDEYRRKKDDDAIALFR
jgi:hypothetical protein